MISALEILFREGLENQQFIIFFSVFLFLISLSFFIACFKNKKKEGKSKLKYKILHRIKDHKEFQNSISHKFLYSLEFKDIEKFQKFSHTAYPKYILVLLVILYIATFYLVIFGIFSFNASQGYFYLSILAILTYLFANFISKMANKNIHNIPTKVGQFEFSIGANGIAKSNSFYSSFYSWEIITACILSEQYLFFMLSRFESAVILPLKDIAPTMKDELLKMIQERFA